VKGYVAKVQGVEPSVPGLDIDVQADGHVTFTAPAGRAIVLEGYDDEPYLRFAGGTVFANSRSSTTALNERHEAPVGAQDQAAPRWERIARGRTHEWDDLRVRGERWTIHEALDGRPLAISGGLVKEERGLGWQWTLVPVLAAAVVYALVLTFRGARRPEPPRAESERT
jgi:hypothetical protein